MRFHLLLCVTLGCGGAQDDGLFGDGGVDASDASDSATDAVTSDTQAPDTGADAGTLSFKCGDNVVADCSQCPQSAQPCVYCNTATPTELAGVCTALHSNCIGGIPNGYQDCSCAGDVSKCPEPYQICNGTGSCHTCSDATGNDTLACKGGGACHATTGICN